MKEKTFLISIIVALVLINTFTLIRWQRFKQSKTIEFASNHNPLGSIEDDLRAYKTNFEVDILNSSSKLNDILIIDSLDNNVSIEEFFSPDQKRILVCRFSQTHCESCVNSAIQILSRWSEILGVQNVMYLGNHTNNRVFGRTISLYGINGAKVYNAPSLDIPAEKLGYPYFFILDNRLAISNVFVPDKGAPGVTNHYLESIKKIFSPM